MRLDDFCKDRCLERIGFLKVDVEGAEVCVMKGAENLLRNRAVELIWIEVEPDNFCEMGDSIDDLAYIMKNVGYTFHLLQPNGSSGPPVDIRRERSPNMIAKPEPRWGDHSGALVAEKSSTALAVGGGLRHDSTSRGTLATLTVRDSFAAMAFPSFFLA